MNQGEKTTFTFRTVFEKNSINTDLLVFFYLIYSDKTAKMPQSKKLRHLVGKIILQIFL